MAREKILRITDDLTGVELTEDEAHEHTVNFQGKTYKLDTTKRNAELLDTYITEVLSGEKTLPHFANRSGRTTGRASGTRKPAPEIKGGATQTDVRQWAKENNLTVSAQGRIANEVVEAYNAAH